MGRAVWFAQPADVNAFSSGSSLLDMPGITLDQVSGHSVTQSSWHVKLTFMSTVNIYVGRKIIWYHDCFLQCVFPCGYCVCFMWLLMWSKSAGPAAFLSSWTFLYFYPVFSRTFVPSFS